MAGRTDPAVLAELARLRQVGGTHRESVVREAFKDLLKSGGRSHDLGFPDGIRDRNARQAMLKADKDLGRIVLDPETTLSGVPREAWEYRLGNRSALEWILDQYKKKKSRDPTIREKFNTYRFADYKDKVIDLLARVTRVSVETQAIVEAMHAAPRT